MGSISTRSPDAYLLRRPGPATGGGIGMLGVADAVARETITDRANAAAATRADHLVFMADPPPEC
jgi:hypothetical protein